MGGKDINTGLMDSVWYIDCKEMSDFIPGETENAQNPSWVQAKCTGISKPKPMSNHTCVVFPEKSKMYLFGGVTAGGKDNLDMYTLELSKF